MGVVALVGRPNVGKSTLFNALTGTRDALVADVPGVTRDRQYGRLLIDGCEPGILIDTGGIADEHQVDILIHDQVDCALEESDLILCVVDARVGLTGGDEAIVQKLRATSKPVIIIVNKIDGLSESEVLADFYVLGFEKVIGVAASHRMGMSQLKSILGGYLSEIDKSEKNNSEQLPYDIKSCLRDRSAIKYALVGRPNVGKSTLTNRMLGEDRVMALDHPGTTTDSIYIPFERQGQNYVIVDTAGVRRKSRISKNQIVEKFSVIKTLKTIDQVDVVVLLIDAQEGLTDQDLGLINISLSAGRALIIGVNKWDGLSLEQRETVKSKLARKLVFLNDFVEIFFISAKHGTAVGDIFPAIKRAYKSSKVEIKASQVTRILESIVADHPPPLVKGHSIKLRYAHMGGQYPPIIVIHGSRVDKLSDDYKRYMINKFRTVLKTVGSPIRLEFKSPENPYAGRRQKLTPRQQYKKKRLMRFVKKK